MRALTLSSPTPHVGEERELPMPCAIAYILYTATLRPLFREITPPPAGQPKKLTNF